MVPHKFVLMGISVLIVLAAIVLGWNLTANLATNVATSQTNTTIVTGKVYHHISNISMGYYYGEGFKNVNKEWVLTEKEGVVYLVFRPIKPSKPQNYIILLYCLPLKEFKENMVARGMINIIEYKLTKGLLRNDSELVLEALNVLEKSFPLELKASIVAGGKEVGVYHRIAYSAKEKMVVPIRIKAPLGRLSKEYVIIVNIIKYFSERTVGGSRFYVYIRPPP